MSDNRWLMRFVGEAREEGARRPSIKGEAKDARVDSICEGYQIRECTASEYQGQSRRRGCDVCMCMWVYMTGGLGSKVRETINRGRSQRTNNHVEHPGIVGEA